MGGEDREQKISGCGGGVKIFKRRGGARLGPGNTSGLGDRLRAEVSGRCGRGSQMLQANNRQKE